MKKLLEEDFTLVDESTNSTNTRILPQDTVPYNIRWASTIPTEPDEPNSAASEQVPSGKVKALTKFYDSLRDTNNNCTESVVTHRRPQLSSSTPTLAKKQDDDKLSSLEEQEIINQLKQWSEFGSMSDDLDGGGQCGLHKSKSCEDSLHTLSSEDYGRCRYLDQVYDKLDGKQQRPIARSEINLNRYHVVDRGWNGPVPPPDGFILRKVKLCRRNCTNVENNRIKLSLTYFPSTPPPSTATTRSCPNLTTQPNRSTPIRPFSPNTFHSSATGRTPTTMRQLKKQHNLIRILKSINRKYAASVSQSKADDNGNRSQPDER